MTVDLMDIEEKAGYQDENWKAKMSEWVSGGKSSESSNVEVDAIGVDVGDEGRDEEVASTKDMDVRHRVLPCFKVLCTTVSKNKRRTICHNLSSRPAPILVPTLITKNFIRIQLAVNAAPHRRPLW